jgi:hypothetical protein
MGLRSWLTKVDDNDEYQSLVSAIQHNPVAHGVAYTIAITKECPLTKGIWVAWSGDGNSLLELHMSPYIASKTKYLDDIIAECPEFGHDPNDFGTVKESLAFRKRRPANTDPSDV